MIKFNQDDFNNFALENKVVGFYKEQVTLKSGRKSHWYINWRKILNDNYATDILSRYVIGFVSSLGLKPNCFYGVPDGSTPLGIIIQYSYHDLITGMVMERVPIAMGRAKPKDHGDPKDRYFVCPPRGKTIVLEDVTTVASSLTDELTRLRELDDCEVIAAIGISDRMQKRDDGRSVPHHIRSLGVNYFSMSNALDLLPRAYMQLKPGEDIARAIEREFEDYGARPLKLLS